MPIKDPISEKEKKLVDALKALTPRELEAYRYFVKEGQMQVSDEQSDHMFELFCNGSTCDQIRKIVQAYSFGQIVACRVIGGWDERRESKRLATTTIVPAQANVTLLESQEFLGDLILATTKKFGKQLKRYIATGEEAQLEGIPLPRSLKEYQIALDMFMKASGQDEKKVVHSGTIGVAPVAPSAVIKPEEDNEATLDELLGTEVVDVDFEQVPPKQITDGSNG
jgi:hypothetical protein